MKVRRELNKLPMDRFIVAHDIKFKYGNIDHLVIRDDGAIFLIETKSHRGTVTYDGKRLLINGRPFKKNPICQIHRSIRSTRGFSRRYRRITPWIIAVLAFSNAEVDGQLFVHRLNVLEVRDLSNYISSYPRRSEG